MTSVVQRPWPARKWAAAFGMVFGLQIALIFLLSDRSVAKTRQPGKVPRMQFVGESSREYLRLNDPTLFARPHAEGFAGLAWLKQPRLESRKFDWTESTNWLALKASQVRPTSFRPEDAPAKPVVAANPQPRLGQPGVLPPMSGRDQSTWRLEGDLSKRALATPLSLPAWAHSELLTNTVVRLIVDADGRVFSAPILLSSSNHKPADDHALSAARSLRFEPVNRNGAASGKPALTSGTLVFEWQTIPVPATNAPPAVVQP